jgi:catechol 2,3-dioxygenase-like lactoylglutathione lyase family enzyme
VSNEFSRILETLDFGRLDRRQLLQAMGILALTPTAALAAPSRTQGWAGGQPKLPFESTGWKTVLLDHLSCKVDNLEKEVSFYNSLMNWAVRDINHHEAVLDIGDWGGLVLRGGYQVSPSVLETQRAEHERRIERARANGLELGPFVPRKAVFDSVCWGIEPWDASKVKAALEGRGLNPVADNRGDFESFHVKDPDGFDVQISNGSHKNRRTKPASAKLSGTAQFDHTDWKTVFLDHMSYQCTDYKKTGAFYQALLGWEPVVDAGNSIQVRIGNVGGTILRNHFGGGQGVLIDHISFGITPFNTESVKAGLEKRGLPARADTGSSAPMETSPYKSYHTTTPNGYDLQISNANLANRGELP